MKAKTKKPNLYEWMCTLPNPLFKFANRAEIRTGNKLLEDIQAAKTEIETRIELHSASIYLIKNKIIAEHKRLLGELLEEFEQCQDAITQYYEIEERDGRVSPS